MRRRDFLYLSGIGFSAGMLQNVPVLGRSISMEESLIRVDTASTKILADVALNAARAKGATYADIRIGRYLNQFVAARNSNIEGIANTESYGVGVRVIANGCWGFAATNIVSKEEIARAAERAVSVAHANAKISGTPVELAPQKGYGEVSWKTPVLTDAFGVSIKDKAALLMNVNQEGLKKGANFVTSSLSFVNEQKYFASTDGSYIDQDIHRIWPTFTATKIDASSNHFETLNALSAPMGMGYEYLIPDEKEKIHGPVTLYRNRYDMLEDIGQAAEKLNEKLKATTVDPGKFDLVLDPSQLFLTIHESVGHSTELDRVLGYEANYAGTSFLTLDKWESKKFNFGNKLVNIVADKLQPNSLGATGYDDEGVKCGKWDLIKDGILVNYQATRDQAHILGLQASQGCSYADDWGSVQFQRMPNVSLQPGKESLSPAEMIKNVEKGVYMLGRNSYSIDQQRYNFQFSGQLTYEIKEGRITGMLKDAAYQANTQEFWNSCAALCDERDYRLGGTFSDGKGQPSQISAVSHGCSTTRFNGVNVINTARKI